MTSTKRLIRVNRLLATARRFWRQQATNITLTYGIVGILSLLWAMGIFTQLQLRTSDGYFVELTQSDTIVLIALDDASFKAYGRSPAIWPRRLYAELVQRVAAGGARVLAFDLLFAEPSPDDAIFAEAIRAARSGDSRLRVVLAAAGSGTPLQDNAYGYVTYPYALEPVEPLKAEAAYLGFVNAFPDNDGLLRRQPSIVQIQDRPQLAFSLAAYLAYLRVPSGAWEQVVTREGNTLYVTPERKLVVDANGLWRQNFFSQPNHGTFAVYSFKDVVEGLVAPEAFKDKLVMVGILNSTGITDQFLVPIGTTGYPMTGLEIQANAVESILQNAALEERLAFETIVFTLAAGTLALLMVFALPLWRWRTLAALLAIVAWVFFCSWAFSVQRQIYPLVYPILGMVLPLSALAWYEAFLIRRQRNRLAAEKQYLAELNNLKTHMIRMASHDLKNPLSRIIGYVDLVTMEGELSPIQTRFLGHIRDSADEMYHIITDILTLEQVRSAEFQAEPVELSRLVMQVVTSQEPDMYRKNQTFVDGIAQEPIYVMGSFHQLSQAAANLINNAVKYTPEGGTITVRVYKDNKYAYLQVQDTGYGIPESALPKLFTDFYRVKTRATASISGTGLGLSLVKTVVDAHHGTIDVKSKEGEGSVFTVCLPLGSAPQN